MQWGSHAKRIQAAKQIACKHIYEQIARIPQNKGAGGAGQNTASTRSNSQWGLKSTTKKQEETQKV